MGHGLWGDSWRFNGEGSVSPIVGIDRDFSSARDLFLFVDVVGLVYIVQFF